METLRESDGVVPLIEEKGTQADARLRYFVAYCWKHGWNKSKVCNTHATIKLKLASVRWIHKRHLGITHEPSLKLAILLL